MRQNGSMRLHTTVNNNFSSYRLPLHNFRDPSHHLSLQDSIRTTTTTTTTTTSGSISSNNNNSTRSSLQRKRCVSVGSQASDIAPRRKLQKQISQLSSLGDANSLLEADGVSSHFQQTLPQASKHNDLRRSLMTKAGNGMALQRAESMTEDCLMPEAQRWKNEEHVRDDETELFTRLVTPMNSIAELNQPTRSRLKLSRIITRRNQDLYSPQASPRVELMRSHLPGMGHVSYASALAQQQQPKRKRRNQASRELRGKTHSNKTLDTLWERFRWRKRGKLTLKPESSLNVSPTKQATRVEQEVCTPTSGSVTPTTTRWKGNLKPS